MIAMFLIGCAGQEDVSTQPAKEEVSAASEVEEESEGEVSAASDAEGSSEAGTLSSEEQVIEIGESSAMTLLKSLKGNLESAIDEGGPANAIQFCNQEAIPLTTEVQENLGRGLEIKRTSFKYRNPDNAPDSFEEEALHYFEQLREENGEMPQYYIQQIEETGEHRYYKPLPVGGLCLNCHGDLAQINPAVQEVLAEKYPDDLAVGYKEGDFRGVVRVSIPAELLEE
jgi:hypothetical protein